MSQFTKELIKAESRRGTLGFILEVAQRGKCRPKKFKHDLTMPLFLYEELCFRGVIRPEDYFINESAFFEFTDDEATISFINLYHCEDLHRRIDHYLVVKFAGSYPVKRGGRMF